MERMAQNPAYRPPDHTYPHSIHRHVLNLFFCCAAAIDANTCCATEKMAKKSLSPLFPMKSHVIPLLTARGLRTGELVVFVSTATNGIDAKGRVSVPAGFRSNVAGGPFDGIYVWPSFDGPWLEGGGQALMDDYLDMIEAMDPYDEARQALEQSIFGEARTLSFDANGRITLPKDLAEHAGLDGKVTFVGLGRRFEIWNPDSHARRATTARAFAKENKLKLRRPARLKAVDQ
jgi:transcriptional regulator MraZ